MKQPKPTQDSKQINETFKQAKKILSGYFNKDYVFYIKKDNMIHFPIGTFFYESENWAMSLDYNWITNLEDKIDIVDNILLLQYLIRDLSTLIPDLEFDSGYYTVFNDKNICAGIIFNSDISDYMEEREMEYDIAKNVLESKLILEYQEECEKLESEKNVKKSKKK